MDQRVFQGFVRSAGNFRIAQSHSEVGQTLPPGPLGGISSEAGLQEFRDL